MNGRISRVSPDSKRWMGKRSAKIIHDCLSEFVGLLGTYRLMGAEQGEENQLEGLCFAEARQLSIQESVG